MKEQKGKDRIHGNRKEGEAKEPDLVQSCWSLGKAQPAEGKREGNTAREEHAPEDALMRDPTIQAAPSNKLLREQVHNGFWNQQGVATEVLIGEKQSPTASPIATCRWASQPERVLVGHRRYSKDSRYGIANESRIEPVEASRPHGNEQCKNGRRQNTIENRTGT